MCRRHNVVPPHECKKTQQLLLQAGPACSSSVKFQGCEFLWLVIGILLFCSCVESQEAVRSPRSHRTLTKLDTRFYHSSCPSLQQITASVVASYIQQDPTAGAPLVRMFFHDCAVNGCDASVLIKSTPNNTAERDAVPNQTLRGFDIVDEIKSQLEAVCPGIVSCADIIAVAAKDAVFQQGGPDWIVELGRKDGVVSSAAEAEALLPSSHSNAATLVASFAALGLTSRDMVTLSGAHTFGRAHCTEVARRFYGYNSSNGMDPSLSVTYGQTLRSLCPQPLNPGSSVPLDPTTPNTFDEVYYSDLLQGKGLMSSDAALVADPHTARYVTEYSQNTDAFFNRFTAAMLKLGRVGVKLGSDGEVRRICSAVN